MKEIEIPEGYEARIVGNKVIILPKESKDERIRKEIIEYLKLHDKGENDYAHTMFSEWFAWLEKQKESVDYANKEYWRGYREGEQVILDKYAELEKQKEHTEELPIRMNGLMQEYVKAGKDEEEQEHRLKCYQLFWDALGDSEFFEQKEQKPIPKFKVGDCIYDKRDSYNRNVIREVGKDYYINAFAQKMDMAYTDTNFEFLERLDDDILPNQPAEWSEEDDKKRKCLIKGLEDRMGFNWTTQAYNREQLIEWLKSLRPQSKDECGKAMINGEPIPTENHSVNISLPEWSEEDERMRKAVLDEIEHQIEIMPDADDMDSDDQDRYNELISMSVWMENLPKCMKPHWKPSKEIEL